MLFQEYNIMIWHLCTLCCNLHDKSSDHLSLYKVILLTLFPILYIIHLWLIYFKTGSLYWGFNRIGKSYLLGLWLDGWVTSCPDFPRTVPVFTFIVLHPGNPSVLGEGWESCWASWVENWQILGKMENEWNEHWYPCPVSFSLKNPVTCLPATLS